MITLDYLKASTEQADPIFTLVQDTITAIYPKYYPQEVVAFFCRLHNRESLIKDIAQGNVRVLWHNKQLIGTGSYVDNHITRVYVNPAFQRQGYGSYIMQNMEKEIFLKYDTIYLDASLPASHLYEKSGYSTVRHEKILVDNDAVLVYEIMQKKRPLSDISQIISEN